METNESVIFTYDRSKVPPKYLDLIKRGAGDEDNFINHLYECNGDYGIALLRTGNDALMHDSFVYLEKVLGLNYLWNRPIKSLHDNYDKLIRKKQSILQQLGWFIATSDCDEGDIPPQFRISGDQFMLLMLRTIPQSTAAITNERESVEYATPTEIHVMKSLVRIANHEGDTLSEEEQLQIRETLSAP